MPSNWTLNSSRSWTPFVRLDRLVLLELAVAADLGLEQAEAVLLPLRASQASWASSS